MPDDKTKTASQYGERINVNKEYEVQYWSGRFRCTAGEVRAAVNKVGVRAADVEKELRGCR